MQCLKKREALLSKLAANKFQINSGTFIAMLLFRILATVKNDKKITVDFSRETVIFLLIKPCRLLKRCERGAVDATPFYMERVTKLQICSTDC